MNKNTLIELVVLLIISITLLTGCGGLKQVRKGPEAIVEPIEYKIGPADVISIIVWRHPEFSLDMTVDSRGILPYPLLGDLDVTGMTTYQVAELFTERLARYIKDPQVRVEVKEYNSQRVIVIGEVNRPGIYYVKDRLTVLDAICMAGSYTEDAVLSNVQVARGDPNNPCVLSTNLKKVIFENDRTEEIILQSGDIVYVPRSLIGNINYALKQITPSLRTYVLGRDLFED